MAWVATVDAAKVLSLMTGSLDASELRSRTRSVVKPRLLEKTILRGQPVDLSVIRALAKALGTDIIRLGAQVTVG